MEEISVIIAFVSIICAILGIILFFKVWGMTNDVSSIRKDLLKTDSISAFAEIFGIAMVEKYLKEHSKIPQYERTGSSSYQLSPEGGYIITSYWHIFVINNDTNVAEDWGICTATVRLSCKNMAGYMNPDNWECLTQPHLKRTNSYL